MKNRTKQLGRFVRSRREDLKLSIRQVARAAKMSSTKLYNIEIGASKLTVEEGTRLATVMGWTDLAHLLTAFDLVVEMRRRPKVLKAVLKGATCE